MKTILFLLLLIISACGGNSATGATETGNSIGAAVTSVFGGEEESARLIGRSLLLARLTDFFVQRAVAQEGGGEEETACEHLDAPPDTVTTSASITPGTYGASSNSVTVTTDDACENGGEYASFTVASHSLNCTSGEGDSMTVLMVDSGGIWRENLETHNTEIYGAFTMQVEGETTGNIRCSLLIEHEESGDTGAFSGICEDENGNAVDQSSDLICTQME